MREKGIDNCAEPYIRISSNADREDSKFLKMFQRIIVSGGYISREDLLSYCYTNRNNLIRVSFNTRHKYTLTDTSNFF